MRNKKRSQNPEIVPGLTKENVRRLWSEPLPTSKLPPEFELPPSENESYEDEDFEEMEQKLSEEEKYFEYLEGRKEKTGIEPRLIISEIDGKLEPVICGVDPLKAYAEKVKTLEGIGRFIIKKLGDRLKSPDFVPQKELSVNEASAFVVREYENPKTDKSQISRINHQEWIALPNGKEFLLHYLFGRKPPPFDIALYNRIKKIIRECLEENERISKLGIAKVIVVKENYDCPYCRKKTDESKIEYVRKSREMEKAIQDLAREVKDA